MAFSTSINVRYALRMTQTSLRLSFFMLYISFGNSFQRLFFFVVCLMKPACLMLITTSRSTTFVTRIIDHNWINEHEIESLLDVIVMRPRFKFNRNCVSFFYFHPGIVWKPQITIATTAKKKGSMSLSIDGWKPGHSIQMITCWIDVYKVKS